MAIKAQLFITCLAEQFFPDVLKGMVDLLERLGVQVAFPGEQTCCGQPFFNSGYRTQARELAIKWLEVFGRDRRLHRFALRLVRGHGAPPFPELFPPGSPEHGGPRRSGRGPSSSPSSWCTQLKVTDVGARFPGKVTYHASCHLLRGLGAREEPKALLRAVQGLQLVPLPGEETCCGFGGVFSVIYPEVSKSMMEAKVRRPSTPPAPTWWWPAMPGCLMNIAGGLRKAGRRSAPCT